MANDQSVKELHEERQKLWDASIANHKRYLNEDTGLFDQKFVEQRTCPACSADSEFFLFNKEGGRYVKCRSCEMVYLNPVFKDQYLEEYYRLNHTVQSEIIENEGDFYTDLYRQGLASIEEHIEKGPILDIGCSTGFFLDLAKVSGWNTQGIELNEAESKYCAAKGHEVQNCLLEEISFDTKFNAITLWDVFEHLKDGGQYFDNLKALLNPGGVIFLQIPSADSLAAKMMQEKCNMYDGLEHVNLYSHNGLSILAENCQLKLESIRTVISEIGVMNNYLNYDSPYLGSTGLKQDIFGLVNETDLHEKLLGYKFQVVLTT